jgi:hypothetical protein
LLVELKLELINADCAKLRATEVPYLVALGWPFAQQQVELILATSAEANIRPK